MATESYNTTINRLLTTYIEVRNWDAMRHYLAGMTHGQFRTASVILSYDVLPLHAEQFWECFEEIVPVEPKAYLVTFLKPAVQLYKEGRTGVEGEELRRFAAAVKKEGRALDEKKTLQHLVPIVRTPKEVDHLLRIFGVEELDERIAYLLYGKTDACYYCLFQALRRLDHDPQQLTHYCNLLTRKRDDKSFNLVSILKCYFDLPQVQGTFSLSLKPFELSRLEASYDAFRQIINRL